MKSYPVTAQMVVRNDEKFVFFAVKSVLPFVDKFLITDNGSNDLTWDILQQFAHLPKVSLQRSVGSPVTKLRQSQLKKTKTPWFLLVDGDEIWPQAQLKKLLENIYKLPQNKMAVVNKTRNCVGDVWHYLSNNFGKYVFGNKKGNFNIRLMRTFDYQIKGKYPWEEYYLNGLSINSQIEKLAFSPAWYLHTSHLARSKKSFSNLGRRKKILDKGILLKQNELPEVFFIKRPINVSDPLVKRSFFYNFTSMAINPLKKIKKIVSKK